jgi:hypothetical protein
MSILVYIAMMFRVHTGLYDLDPHWQHGLKITYPPFLTKKLTNLTY